MTPFHSGKMPVVTIKKDTLGALLGPCYMVIAGPLPLECM
jgi:hypothetical protein